MGIKHVVNLHVISCDIYWPVQSLFTSLHHLLLSSWFLSFPFSFFSCFSTSLSPFLLFILLPPSCSHEQTAEWDCRLATCYDSLHAASQTHANTHALTSTQNKLHNTPTSSLAKHTHTENLHFLLIAAVFQPLPSKSHSPEAWQR